MMVPLWLGNQILSSPFHSSPNLIPLCFLKGDLVNNHFLHCGWGYDGHPFSISGTLLGYECETGLFSPLGVPKDEISLSAMHIPLFSSLLEMNNFIQSLLYAVWGNVNIGRIWVLAWLKFLLDVLQYPCTPRLPQHGGCVAQAVHSWGSPQFSQKGRRGKEKARDPTGRRMKVEETLPCSSWTPVDIVTLCLCLCSNPF